MQPMKDLPGLKLKKDLKGIGGFLAWFIAGMTIGTPIVNALYIVLDSLTQPFIVVAFEAVFVVPLVGYSVLVGIRLWRIRPHALRQAKIFVVFMFIWSSLQIALFASTDQGTVRTIVWAVVLFIYLNVSNRVKNTYGPNVPLVHPDADEEVLALDPQDQRTSERSKSAPSISQNPSRAERKRWPYVVIPILAAIILLAVADQVNKTVGDSFIKMLEGQIIEAQAIATPPKTFESLEGGFSIQTPVDFASSSQAIDSAVGPVKMHTFDGTNSSGYFDISYLDYPKTVLTADKEKMLDGGRDGMLSSTKGQLISETKIAIGAYPGRDITFNVKGPNGEDIGYRVRLYLVKQRLYEILVGYSNSGHRAKAVEAFLESFKLTGN